MSQPRILVIGNANVDLTSYVDVFPAEGETVLSSDFVIGMGGKGANQAVACSRAGSPTALIGAVGQDAFGDLMWAGLSDESLDLSYLQRRDIPSGTATIMVDASGANQIAVFVGASGSITPDDAVTAITGLDSGRYFVSQLEISLDVVSASLQHAKSRGMTTVVNTAPYRRMDQTFLDATDWSIANEGEAQALLSDTGLKASVGEDPAHILDQIASWSALLGVNLVITLGSGGAVGVSGGDASFHAVAPSVTAIDTVGAGDCFTGYFVALMDQGFGWQQAMTGAVHAASHSVQSAGAQSSYPSPSQAEDFTAVAASTTVG